MNEYAKAGYDAAIRLTDISARNIWSIFIALVATNAFLASFAAFLSKDAGPDVLARLIGGLGTFVCVAWALIMRRSFQFYNYYFACARQFEAAAFGDAVNMIRRGKELADGDPVTVGDEPHQLNYASRLRVQWLIYAIILLFFAMYVYILIFGGAWRHAG